MTKYQPPTPPRWPECELFATYGMHRPIQWRMRSACAACGGVIEAAGITQPGEPFSETTTCAQCGAQYVFEGKIVD